jgi:hypothetical protein
MPYIVHLKRSAEKELGEIIKATHIFAAHKHSYFTGGWDGLPNINAGAGAKFYGFDSQHYFFYYIKVPGAGDKLDLQV